MWSRQRKSSWPGRERRTKLAARGHGLAGGVNFSIYSRNAPGMELILFDRDDDPQPSRVIPIDAATNRTDILAVRISARPGCRMAKELMSMEKDQVDPARLQMKREALKKIESARQQSERFRYSLIHFG